MLHICQQTSGLNIQSDTYLLDDSYFPIINKCLLIFQNLLLPYHLLPNFMSFFSFFPWLFRFPFLFLTPPPLSLASFFFQDFQSCFDRCYHITYYFCPGFLDLTPTYRPVCLFLWDLYNFYRNYY